MDRPATHRGWTGEDIRALVVESGARLGIPIEREAAETDFGRLVRGTSVAVISPRSVDEVEKIIAFANTRGLQLTARGRGLSQGGQAIAANSVTLDLNALDRVGQPDVERQSITCEGGASYRAVVSATAPRGLLPTVVPANLELSVGGVLSAAGFGASSHVHGPAIADVASLEVITGGGRRVVADEEHERRIFDAVLGGTGRCGILVGATLRLRPFLPKVRRFCLLYDTIGPWLEDQRALIASGAAQYLECFCTPSVQGFRRDGNRSKLFAQWFYALHASFEYDDAPPSSGTALAGLHPSRLVWSDDMDTVEYVDRNEPRFVGMRRSGATTHQHPWVETLLPADALSELLPRVLDEVPLALGEAVRVFFVATRNPRPFFMTPTSAEVVGIAFTPIQVPPHLQDDALAAARSIHDITRTAGAKRYISGYLGSMDQASWRDHYGDRYDAWVAAKQELDPNHVLVSNLFPADATRT